MKVLSWNVNGLRSVAGKGFLEWMGRSQADVVCLQETKAHPDQLEFFVREPHGYRSAYSSAEKAGYSGVSIFSKEPPLDQGEGLGLGKASHSFDREGRVVWMDFEKIRIVSAYFPNSQRDHARLGFKLEFCAALEEATRTWGRGGRAVLVSGDYNIAHQPIDLKNPKANEKTAGFLPEEREWMSRFLHSGWIDTFRAKQPELRDQYSWWSYRPGVREKNIGWRIDYHCLSPWGGMQIDRAWIEMEVLGSDHAPVGLEISER